MLYVYYKACAYLKSPLRFSLSYNTRVLTYYFTPPNLSYQLCEKPGTMNQCSSQRKCVQFLRYTGARSFILQYVSSYGSEECSFNLALTLFMELNVQFEIIFPLHFVCYFAVVVLLRMTSVLSFITRSIGLSRLKI